MFVTGPTGKPRNGHSGRSIIERFMEIVYRPLADLVKNPDNPRKPKPGGVSELAESIKKNQTYFEARPILLSDRTGQLVIIGGERRSEAAAMLGMQEVPTILLTGLTEEQEHEILIIDNTHAGVWDDKKLQELQESWGEKLPQWLGEKPRAKGWRGENQAEIKFSEVLNEEHNYIVLYFDNSVDWLQVLTLLGLETVKAYSTRKDGKLNKGNTRLGIGRILRGPEVLEKLKKEFGK